MAYIEFRNVHKSFGNNEVLKGINLSIDEGEFVTLRLRLWEKVRFSAVFQAGDRYGRRNLSGRN